MTRQEYERKADNGTLTVGDVLTHPQFATGDELAILRPPQTLTEATNRTADDICEGLRKVAEQLERAFNAVEEQDTAEAVGLWDAVGELLTDDNASDGEACNTDCQAFARGTCPFGVQGKSDCPRYRQYYPDRVATASTR